MLGKAKVGADQAEVRNPSHISFVWAGFIGTSEMHPLAGSVTKQRTNPTIPARLVSLRGMDDFF
jgi:hypothetical protein